MDCRRCGAVKQEKLPWLADNPFYTKRFAFFVGRRCRAATIRDVARELHLDWKTVKELEKQYMREQLRRVGTPAVVIEASSRIIFPIVALSCSAKADIQARADRGVLGEERASIIPAG